MTAFIQKHRGEHANINMLTAAPGFREKGYPVEHFEWPEPDGLALEDLSKSTKAIRSAAAD